MANKIESKMFGFRCPNDIREKLEVIAEKEGRTLSNLVVKILRDYTEKEPRN